MDQFKPIPMDPLTVAIPPPSSNPTSLDPFPLIPDITYIHIWNLHVNSVEIEPF